MPIHGCYWGVLLLYGGLLCQTTIWHPAILGNVQEEQKPPSVLSLPESSTVDVTVLGWFTQMYHYFCHLWHWGLWSVWSGCSVSSTDYFIDINKTKNTQMNTRAQTSWHLSVVLLQLMGLYCISHGKYISCFLTSKSWMANITPIISTWEAKIRQTGRLTESLA